MVISTCKICGKDFESGNFRKFYCEECKVGVCVICGRTYEKKPPYTSNTCSRACTGKRRAQTGAAKAGAQKMVQTKNERYGKAGNIFLQPRKPRKCKWCGKEFIPNGSKQEYCKDKHYSKCVICGKPVLITEFCNIKKTCSEECETISRVNSLNERGYEESNRKNRETCLKKYGTEHYSSLEECKEKVRATNKERFGYDYYMQDPKNREAFTKMSLEKFGVPNPSQSPEIIEKIIDTLTEQYGGCGTASEIISAKIRATNLERYGDECQFRNEDVKAKIRATNRERYGKDWYFSTDEWLSKLIIDGSKADKFAEFRKDPQKYVDENYSEPPYAYELARDLGVCDTSIYGILIKKNCRNAINRSKTSYIERQVHEYLASLVAEDEIMWCYRRAIAPLELDFYLPNYKFAIECNPTFTHNSSIDDPWGTPPKPYNYHLNKTIACENKEIFLFHIFGYEWEHKQEIIKSMICNALGKCTDKIYARNTEVVELDSSESRSFLEANHRQGPCNSNIRLGLKVKETGELVSVMTFGSMRYTMGKSIDDVDGTYELSRFCSKLYTNVVGGASKLLSYFEKHYSWSKIVSFSDRAHTRGSLYSTLGFSEVRKSEPGYVWADIWDKTYFTRVQCQKNNLPRLFPDDVTEETIKEKSEKQIMEDHGYTKVCDCGTIRWEKIHS